MTVEVGAGPPEGGMVESNEEGPLVSLQPASRSAAEITTAGSRRRAAGAGGLPAGAGELAGVLMAVVLHAAARALCPG